MNTFEVAKAVERGTAKFHNAGMIVRGDGGAPIIIPVTITEMGEMNSESF
jgi:hypothetical protein